jgi:hypothetical protein
MSGLSIPIPKAFVATIAFSSPRMNRSWFSARSEALSRPW